MWDCERGADAETMYVRLASVIKNYRYKCLYLYRYRVPEKSSCACDPLG